METKKQIWQKNIIIIFLLAISVTIWFWQVIFYDNIIIYRDLGRYFYPLRKFGAEALKSRMIPFWNQYISCGKPFLATLQTVVFYPLSILYYILPSFDLAFNWFIIIHFFLAGLFMYFLMRHWNFGRPASFFSSIVFTYSGYLTSVIHMNTTLSSVIWTPLIILFYDKALESKKIRYIFLTSLFLGLQFLGGIPVPIYGTFWILFFYTLAFFRGLKTFAVFIASFVIFILLFMFQILPFKELTSISNLVSGMSFNTAAKWSLTPAELLAFVIPYIRGDISVPSGSIGPQEWLTSFYIGVPAFIFTILLFFLKPAKKAYFFGAVLLASIIIALGRYTPLYYLLYKYLPGINQIRYPVKFIFITTFAFSVLAGMGMDSLLNEKDKNKRNKIAKWILLINICITAMFSVFIIYWQEIGDYIMRHAFFNKQVTGDLFNKNVFVYLNNSRFICQFFIIFSGSALLLVLYLNNKMRKNIFMSLVIILTFSDLAAVNMGINKIIDRRYFSLTPNSIKELKKDRSLFRIFQTKEIWEINRTIFGLDYSSGMFERKETLACNTAMEHGIYDTRGYDSIEIGGWYDFMLFLDELPFKEKINLLKLLNVRYIISAEPVNEDGVTVFYKNNISCNTSIDGEKIYKYFYINKIKDTIERAFLADQAVVVKDKSAVLGIMKNENFNPRKVVILEEDSFSPQSIVHSPQPKAEYAKITSYKSEEVTIETEISSPKWLVLGDTYYPGWEVFINGKKDKIYKADYFLRAVYLDKGRHTVKFIYNPKSFKIGLLISILTLLGIVLIWKFKVI